MKIKNNIRYLIQNEEDYKDFLKRCNKRGVLWAYDEEPTRSQLSQKISIPIVLYIKDDKLNIGFLNLVFDKIYKKREKDRLFEKYKKEIKDIKKTPKETECKKNINLSKMLGWEDGYKYTINGCDYKIKDGYIYYCDSNYGEWYRFEAVYSDHVINLLREATKVEQEPPKRYYARIKGWDVVTGREFYWNHDILCERVFIDNNKTTYDDSFLVEDIKTIYTLEEWSELGINESNADFEEA